MSIMRYTLLFSMLVVQGGSGSAGGQDGGTSAPHEKPDIVLESVQIGRHAVQFYVDLGPDSAILGFSIEGTLDQRRYFPIYASTYRGLPSVTLDVYVTLSQEEMWIRSSWPGYDVLAYHRMGTDRCMTRYGEISSTDKLMADKLGGGTARFPEMDRARASKVATVRYESK